MVKLKKFETIYQLLKNEISSLSPGEPVMSVRELMKHYQVSQITVTRAIRQLQEEGLIESSAGRGTRRAGEHTRHTIVFIASDYVSSFGQIIRETFEEHFNGGEYLLKCASYDHRTLKLDKSILAAEAVIFNINQDFTSELLVQLAELQLPIVFVDVMPQTLPLDAVCTDNELGGAMAADWFLRHGHTRCAFLQSAPNFHSAVSRRRAFLRQLTLAGHEGIVIDSCTESGENSTAKAYETMKQYVQKNGLNFTALFCDSDLGALGALKVCHELGVKVPDALNIIGYDNIPEGEYFHPGLSTIDQNIAMWAQEVEAIIAARLSGNRSGVMQRYVTPRFVLRESTVKLEH